MNLFGLEGTGFIISLGITLLLSGLIMYYCVQRMNQLNNSLVKQGEIIQSFIYKFNNLELQYSSSNITTNGSNELLQDKIDVSDDDDESDVSEESDDESDVSEDSDDESDVSEDDKKNIKLLAFDGNTTSNIVDMAPDNTESDRESDSDSQLLSDKVTDDEVIYNAKNSKNISDIQKLISNNLIASSNSSIEKMDTISLDSTHKNTSDNVSLNDKNEDDDSKKIIDLENDIDEHINYNKLKVTELKELAMKKNLVKSNDTTKYKKDELIQLLQK